MMRPKRILTQADFQRSQLLYRGKIQNSFDFKGRNIFELQNGEFFIRQDIHLLAPVGFFPVVEIFRIDGELVLAYFEKWQYTFVEQVKVIKSKLIQPFEGFAYERRYRLQNRQIWQQVSHNYTNSSSSGYVKIINDQFMKVDRWIDIVEVQEVTQHIPFDDLWKKTYIVNHADGHCQIQLTKRIRGSFYGTVLYPLQEDSWDTLQQPNFFHWNETEVYEMCTEWITQNLGGDFSVEEFQIEDYQ